MQSYADYVVFDLDDTCADLASALPDLFNQHLSEFAPGGGWTANHIPFVFDHYPSIFQHLVNDEILENLSPLPHARDTVEAVINAGYVPVVCTARSFHPYAHQMTSDWLKHHKFPDTHVIISDLSKVTALRHILPQIRLVTDDNVRVIREFQQYNVPTLHLKRSWHEVAVEPSANCVSAVKSTLGIR